MLTQCTLTRIRMGKNHLNPIRHDNIHGETSEGEIKETQEAITNLFLSIEVATLEIFPSKQC